MITFTISEYYLQDQSLLFNSIDKLVKIYTTNMPRPKERYAGNENVRSGIFSIIDGLGQLADVRIEIKPGKYPVYL